MFSMLYLPALPGKFILNLSIDFLGITTHNSPSRILLLIFLTKVLFSSYGLVSFPVKNKTSMYYCH